MVAKILGLLFVQHYVKSYGIQNNYGYQLTRSIDETSIIVVASVNVC